MKINLQAQTKEEYYEKFLQITSALSPPTAHLAPAEIELLAKFMALPEQMHFYPFSPKAKKIVNASLPRPLSTQNMSMKVCGLIDKKYLVRDEDNFVDYSPSLKQIIKSQTLDVNLQYRPTNKASS